MISLTGIERRFLKFHEALYIRTDGRLGHRLIGVPTLLLRTKGNRSGLTRTAALIYARDGDGYVLVASNHGYDRAPGWFLNIQAEPRVGVQLGKVRMVGVAAVVAAGDPDYPRLWALVNRGNHGRYDGYQSKTSRLIPLVVIRPA
jgi:deazaflavin-dependent oxidoreductase (nitroreductase family)